MDTGLKDMSLDEVIAQLTKLREMSPGTEWKVRIGWSTGRRSCVGRILGTASGNEGTAWLFPVPEDIGNINALTGLMVRLSCDKALREGRECGTCPDAGGLRGPRTDRELVQGDVRRR